MYEVQDAFAPVPREKTMECHIDEDQTMVDPDEVIPLYKGEISYLDDEIGKVLARLEAWGIADETLVVLLADHGESMTEHDIRFCHAGMFEQVLHVPMIMRWPGVLPAGLRVTGRTGSADVLPTVLPLLGIDVPSPDLSGLDLAPALARPDTVLHDVLFSESFAGKIRAVYAGEHKLIQLFEEDWSLAGDRLYRPEADPGEAENLIAAEPGLAADLAARLDAWLARAEQLALPAVEDYQLDAETEEALRSLGYID
jgi:arylsulfatase A-like enzyme